jgi:hypothetical protein
VDRAWSTRPPAFLPGNAHLEHAVAQSGLIGREQVVAGEVAEAFSSILVEPP